MLRQGLGCEPGLNSGTGLENAVLLSLGGLGRGSLVPSRALERHGDDGAAQDSGFGTTVSGGSFWVVRGLSRKLSSVASWSGGWTGRKEK